MNGTAGPQASSDHVIYRAQRALALLLGVVAAFLPIAAHAHVKWFAPYEVAEQPQPLVTLVSVSYALLFATALIALWVTCRLEPSKLGAAVNSLPTVTPFSRPIATPSGSVGLGLSA
jgi:hypothetical protein